jgi:hypothetical protein
VVEAKILREYICNCKNKYNINVSVDERKIMFSEFWKVGNCSVQIL